MSAPTGARRSMGAALALPIVFTLLLVGLLVYTDPAGRLTASTPPAEEIAFERVVLAADTITLHVRNVGPQENAVAQVLVDDAYWVFRMEPSATLPRYGAGTITLTYPWVEGEAHVVKILSPTGTPFEHEIGVAVASPVADRATVGNYALVGILVGVLPVAAGMVAYPALARASDRHANAVLALTLGVLGFLGVDTILEGFELSEELPGAYHATGLFFVAALFAVLAVLGLERMLKRKGLGAVSLAALIALSIGLHNLGEGLLIGAAFAVGSMALGSALIAGFAIHNITEGPAIVAPLTRGAGLPWGRFLGLAALAGVPTIAGAWMGAFTASGLLTVLFFGLGAGAILVVLVQVGRAMSRDEGGLWTPMNAAAFALGFVIMLATSFLTA